MMCRAWAEEEFGHVDLGDKRRTRRVVGMAARLLERPAATVTDVYGPGAEREGAYRALESEHGSAEAMELARGIACARRMEREIGRGICLVAVDKTSLQLSDRTKLRDFGSVGARRTGARGVQVITAQGLDGEGASLGILNQKIWARSEARSPARRPGHKNRKRVRDHRLPEERESHRFVEVARKAADITREHAPSVTPWLHIDAEGDFWGIHRLAAELPILSTVRMIEAHLVRDGKGKRRPLMTWLKRLGAEHWMEVSIPAHDGRPERRALLSVRFGFTMLAIPARGGRRWVPKWFVYVNEPWPAEPSKRIRWILATTYPVESVEEAVTVIENYTRRWRIEDFHRTWKSGACNVEASQLQSFESFSRWAILTSSMAARAEHIKHYSREYPDAPATLIFSQEEIDTMLLWRHANMPKKKPPYQPGEVPRLHEMTRWVAELGGHMGNTRLPGSVTITRGLEKLSPLVQGRRLSRIRVNARSG